MKQQLFQVFAEDATAGGALVGLGPKMPKKYCEEFAASISRAAIEGRNKMFHNPLVTAVS